MAGANRVYGMLNGVEGLLNERVADLTATLGFRLKLNCSSARRPPIWQSLLQTAGQSGTSEVYEKPFAILKKLDIGYFFYIGGNDSMDTICKLSGLRQASAGHPLHGRAQNH